jgi:hypothetical protein
MSSPYRRVYPGSNRLFFDGGLNNKYERSIIEDNESPDCLNVQFSAGSVATRNGAVKLNTAAIGSFVGDGLYTRRANDGSETMCAFANGTMYTLGTTTFTAVASATSVWTGGVRVAAVQDENYLFISNGNVIPYKWDGTLFTRHGIYPPTTTSTVSSQATGVLTGQYQYKITNVNSALVESDVGPATSTFTAASATLRVTLPTFAVSFGVSARRVYRTEASGTVFKRVATVNDNTTTTYDDNIADSALGVTAPTDNGVPPKFNFAIYHANRIFVVDPTQPQYVWYSNLGDPYTFASTNFIRVGDNTTDLVKGLAVYNNALLIVCEKSLHIVYMPDADDANWSPPQRLSTSHGGRSPFGVAPYADKILVPASDQTGKFVGMVAVRGNSVDPSAALLTFSASGSEMKTDKVEPDMFLINETYIGNVTSINYKNRLYITMPYGQSQVTNNRIYVMDFSISNLSKNQKESWVPWTGLNAAQFTVYGGRLYYISSIASGFVYQIEDTGVYSDDGVAINSYFWTKEFAGSKDEVNTTKDFRYANFLIDNAGSYFMNINYRVDSDSDASGQIVQVPLTSSASQWGSMMWGTSTWGGGVDQTDYRLYLGSARGKRIQFRFSNQNTVNQRFKVHWGTFNYIVKGYR